MKILVYIKNYSGDNIDEQAELSAHVLALQNPGQVVTVMGELGKWAECLNDGIRWEPGEYTNFQSVLNARKRLIP